MFHSNEKGLTLVETLAIIIIGSILMVLVFNIVSSSLSNSKKIQERAHIQSEANYLLVVLREFHERGDQYTIMFNDEELIIGPSKNIDGEVILEELNKKTFNNYLYKVNDDIEPITIYPKIGYNTFPIKFTVKSRKYPNIEQTTTTVLQIL